jgi:glutamine phosphoribosylpyrophosphate amidotransferase
LESPTWELPLRHLQFKRLGQYSLLSKERLKGGRYALYLTPLQKALQAIINRQTQELMCSVIGCYLEEPTPGQIETLKQVFLESKVRGMHSTGFSVVQDNKVITVVEPLPADTFLDKHFNQIKQIASTVNTFELIGHCRYSTSDLQYNQPIQVFDDLALAHNGVVDQRPPVHWKDYGYELQTSNDSELLYQCAHSGKEPLKEFTEASMAVCELSVTRGLRWYRNGKRPLHFSKVGNGWFICSTKDIAKRAGLGTTRKCRPGMVYTPDGNEIIQEMEDLIP